MDKAELVEDIIDTRLKSEGTDEEKAVPGIVQSLRDAQNDANCDGSYRFKPEHVSGIIRSILFAGVTTSACTIQSLLLILLKYPDVQTQIQAEIDDVVGRDRVPCLEDKALMPYTEAVIFEVTRYASNVPIPIPHSCSEDVEFLGYLFPKGCKILLNFWYAHHDERVFRDPWTFDPTRFLDDNGQLIPSSHPTRHLLLPFGVGKRSCPGEIFAKSRIFLLITLLLQKFTLKPADDNAIPSCHPKDYGLGAIIQPLPFALRAIPRPE